MAANRDYRRTIERMLRDHGVEYRVRYGRHKLAEYIGKDGRRYLATLSVTNSNTSSIRNARSDLRRQLTRAGYIVPRTTRTS